jgi:hypothetical protein
MKKAVTNLFFLPLQRAEWDDTAPKGTALHAPFSGPT